MSRKRLSPNDYSAVTRVNLDANFARIGFRTFTTSGIATQYRFWVGAFSAGNTITFAAYSGTNGASTVIDEASGRTTITATGDQFHPVNAPFQVTSGNSYGVGADWDATGNIQYIDDSGGYYYRSITPPPWPAPFNGSLWTWSLCIELWGHEAPAQTQVNGGDDIYDGLAGILIDGVNFVDYEDSGINPKAWLWSSSTFDAVNAVEQTVTSIADAQLAVTVDAGGLSTGTLYMFVETGLGQISAGFPVPLVDPPSGNSISIAAQFAPMTANVTASQTNAADISATVPGMAANVTVSQRNAVSVDARLPAITAEITAAQQNAIAINAQLAAMRSDIQITQVNPIGVAALFPNLIANIFATNTTGDNYCTISAVFPSMAASVSATQRNAASVGAVLPSVTADVLISQRNAASVAGEIPALSADASATQRNPVSIGAQFSPMLVDIPVTQENAAAIAVLFPAVTANIRALVGNVITIRANIPALTAAVEATQENPVSLNGAFPAMIADIEIVPETADDTDVIWRDTQRIILKQLNFGSDSQLLAFDIPGSWQLANLTGVNVSISDRAGNVVLASDECDLWPSTTIDGDVEQFDDSFILASGSTAPLKGDMLTIIGANARENIIVKAYDSVSRTVTSETLLQNTYADDDLVYGNIVAYYLDISDTSVFTAGKTFVATWSPVGTGTPFKTMLQVTKQVADTSSIERRFERLYPRAFAAFKAPIDRFNDMVTEAQNELEIEMQSALMDYNRIVGESIMPTVLMAKMACLWLRGADEDLEDERKHITTEYQRLFALMQSLPLWTDSDQDGIQDTASGETTSHEQIFGRQW